LRDYTAEMEGLAATEGGLAALRRVHDGHEDGTPALYHYRGPDDDDGDGDGVAR
jgi:hypothetical protein